MGYHHRPYNAPAGAHGSRLFVNNAAFNAHAVAHADNTTPEPRKHKEDNSTGQSSYTTLSAACKKGSHSTCWAKKCQCACGHPVGR